MIKKDPLPNTGKTAVIFEFPNAPWVKQVHLVGDFNNWNETATPLSPALNGGVWRVRLELERGRQYQFRYLVNKREWHNDWHAERYVPNIHGSDNSVVVT